MIDQIGELAEIDAKLNEAVNIWVSDAIHLYSRINPTEARKVKCFSCDKCAVYSFGDGPMCTKCGPEEEPEEPKTMQSYDIADRLGSFTNFEERTP